MVPVVAAGGGGGLRDISKDILVAEEVGPVADAVGPIVELFSGAGGGLRRLLADLLLDEEVLVAHVLDFGGGVFPGPEPGEGGRVAGVVEGVDVGGDRPEFLLAGLHLG